MTNPKDPHHAAGPQVPNKPIGTNQSKKQSTTRAGDTKSSPRAGRKPYAGKSEGEHKSSFTGGEKKSYSPRKPYSGRPADSDDRPKRTYGNDSGDKKPYSSSRAKPYSGRVTSSDSDRPKRSFNNDEGSEKKSFTPRKPYSGRETGADDKPKRTFSSDEGTDRRSGYTGSKPRTGSGERKYAGKPSAGGGYPKREGGSEPFRKSAKSSYNKILPDRDAPVKTLRGRKEKDKDAGPDQA